MNQSSASSMGGNANATAIRRYFYTPLLQSAAPVEIRRWWEQRRLLFNGMVGSAGLISFGASMFFALLPPAAPRVAVPWLALLGLLLAANVLYYAGPAVDILLRRFYGTRAHAAGPVLLRGLFAFAIGLSLLPVPLVALGWLARAAL